MRGLPWTIFLVCLTTPIGVTGVQSQSEVAVREAVEEFVSAWKAGDTDRLAHVVAESGAVVWLSGQGGEARVNSMSFAQILERRKPQSEAFGLERIHSIDVVDDLLAVTKVEVRRRGGTYIDYYTLYRVGETWRVSTKTFVTRHEGT